MTSASSSLRSRAASELRSAAANLTGVKGAFIGARVEYSNDLIWHAARRPALPPDPGTDQCPGPRPAGDRFSDDGPPRAGVRRPGEVGARRNAPGFPDDAVGGRHLS